MIEHVQGNILNAQTEALVNTVNCVGVMGKGIALQFKKAFPENFKTYRNACQRGEVKPGRMFVFDTGQELPRYIINFPTKRHWRDKSRYEDIEAGLQALVKEITARNISSIAVPPLGSGLGGLDWAKIKPMIERAFSDLPNVQIQLFKPEGSPQASEMPVGSDRPHLTTARALFIKLMQQYKRFAYRLTLLEIQKLAYLLQESGLNLRLSYVRHYYGPYAHNLNKVLEILEGHYISGYGDTQKPDVEIKLLPDAIDAADVLLSKHLEAYKHLNRVADLVDGFETPYGMEMLSSVHWLAVHERLAVDQQSAISAMAGWNERKKCLFKPEHICIAWDRLQEEGWITY
ncbi:Appr-1-p processing domain protein [Desulfonatronospira thiodismutans ASO3-1]|uniref:Appr-1-p processing domain protein n=1 Tax=Desulfonatronospira thiodismutans ASO3-1 TaxID=555779 RepID=D6SPZ4_9BACT|nr:macro domain-containing protein [Desulfonatronospira thiodismutans]EFI34820.1 Appr-1-p processing domain protein [Desulfonatronospira thiodismutans ASO3-1]